MTCARVVLGVVAVASAGTLAGCGATTLEASALEREIATELARQTGERPRVDCPADREAATGVAFRCALELGDGSRSAARVTVLDDDGRFRFELDPPGADRAAG